MQNENRARTRLISREQKARLQTLENPLLYANFVKKIEKLNPDFDLELIDKSLEPEEALMDLKRKNRDLNIGLNESEGAEFREFLDQMGIENSKVQSLVAMQEPPLTETELATLSYVLNMRSEHAKQIDQSLKAPVTGDLRKWSNNANRFDLPGLKY